MEKEGLKKFIKRERTAFIWVNVGIIFCLAVVLVWEHLALSELLPGGCAIHDFFHIYCPGCGGTRAVYYMIHLQPIKSFLYHPLVPFVTILLVEYYVGAVITLVRKNGKRYYYLRDWFCYVALGIILVNWILRNVLLIKFHIDYIGDLVQFWS